MKWRVTKQMVWMVEEQKPNFWPSRKEGGRQIIMVVGIPRD